MNNTYHKIWMEKHGVSAEWMEQALRNGFDIHHVDGDHTNNEPGNLVMIYHGDHFQFHGGSPGLRNLVNIKGKWVDKEEWEAQSLSDGRKAYEIRASGKPWLDVKAQIPSAWHKAKKFAQHSGKEWPIPVKISAKSHAKHRKERSSFFDGIKDKRVIAAIEMLAK